MKCGFYRNADFFIQTTRNLPRKLLCAFNLINYRYNRCVFWDLPTIWVFRENQPTRQFEQISDTNLPNGINSYIHPHPFQLFPNQQHLFLQFHLQNRLNLYSILSSGTNKWPQFYVEDIEFEINFVFKIR